MTPGDSLTGVGYAQQAMATHAVVGSLYEFHKGLVSYRYWYRETGH
jgi:hypothetical protein